MSLRKQYVNDTITSGSRYELVGEDGAGRPVYRDKVSGQEFNSFSDGTEPEVDNGSTAPAKNWSDYSVFDPSNPTQLKSNDYGSYGGRNFSDMLQDPLVAKRYVTNTNEVLKPVVYGYTQGPKGTEGNPFELPVFVKTAKRMVPQDPQPLAWFPGIDRPVTGINTDFYAKQGQYQKTSKGQWAEFWKNLFNPHPSGSTLYRTPYHEPIRSLAEWASHYDGKTQYEITHERPDQYYGPFKVAGGPMPDWRYVRLPNGLVMDMRHVLTVGMQHGEGKGALVEIGQNFADRASANSKQDYFSNAMGRQFLKYVQEHSDYYDPKHSTKAHGNSRETNIAQLFLKFIEELFKKNNRPWHINYYIR
ncbi:MAG: hypothetical protein V4649_16020 [Bacteroidota bacterium]